MPSFWLEVNFNGKVENYTFDRTPITLGRERGSVDFVLDHPTVSRQHAQIAHDPARGYRLVVISRGGLTAVDGAQAAGEVTLYNGSVINLGQMQCVFKANDAQPKPQAAGFGSQPGFGAQQGLGAQQGFGAQPGFGAQSGFGEPAATEQPAATASPSAAGFGAPSADEPKSVWDEIAQSADEEEDAASGPADNNYFARMEAAQARGQEKSKGISPLALIGGVLIIGLLVFILLPSDGPGPEQQTSTVTDSVEPKITVSCLTPEDCVAEATNRYSLAKASYEEKGARVSNLFIAYKSTLEVAALLEQGQQPVRGEDGVFLADKIPASMPLLAKIHDASRAELDSIYKEQRRLYHYYKQRQMGFEMKERINTINSYFPDDSTREAQSAKKMVIEMKKLGLYSD